jgi:Bacterial mobilisation protein (MobC)
MNCTETLKARVSAELKLQVKVVADRDLLTEAAWLKRLVIRELQAADVAGVFVGEPGAGGSRRPGGTVRGANGCVTRVYVRLRNDDRLLLEARAAARGMRPATYLSVLTRAHLRELISLPKEELLALKRSIGELGSIGRNINQIAKAANEGGRLPSSVREEFRAMFKVCEALRVNTKALLKTNEMSWSRGHAEASL